MPAARTPAPEDAVTARRILLTGLAQDAALPDLLGEMEPLHPRNNTFPGEVFLRLAADALAWAGVSPADPLPLEGDAGAIPARVLRAGPGPAQAPVRGAGGRGAARRRRTGPARRVAWWQADDFWQYALLAAVAYVRAAAEWAGVPVREACKELAERSRQQPG